MKYIQTIPHSAAGIGHQLYNYLFGLTISKLLDIEFLHTPLSSPRSKDLSGDNSWEHHLNLYSKFKSQPDVKVDRVMQLPRRNYGYFLDSNKEEVERNIQQTFKEISNLADGCLIQCRDEYLGVIGEHLPLVFNDLRECYFNRNKHINHTNPTVCMHIRRGDVANNPGRFVANDYYREWIDFLRNNIDNVNIKIYSEGTLSSFTDLQRENVKIILNSDPKAAFYDLCTCDVLIGGKSSFSNIPAIINNNFRVLYPLNAQNIWVDGSHNPEKDRTMMFDGNKEKVLNFLNNRDKHENI